MIASVAELVLRVAQLRLLPRVHLTLSMRIHASIAELALAFAQ